MNIKELELRIAEVQKILENPDTPAAELDAAVEESKSLQAQVEAHNTRVRAANEARVALSGVQAEQAIVAKETSDTRVSPAGETGTRLSAGETFIRSGASERFIAQGMQGNVTVEVPLSVRTLIDSTSGQGGAFQRNPLLQTPVMGANADRLPQVADLLDRGVTEFSSVDYIQDDTAAGAGGVAAETAEGALKPQAAFAFSQKTAPVATVAHWVPITRQSVADKPALQTYIDGRMRYGLVYRLDSQILNGNGTTPNLRGLLNASGIGTYAPSQAEAKVISIRKAKTIARKAELPADGCVLAPDDWETVELSTDSTGEFRITPSPLSALPPRIWGLSVVDTMAMTAGTGLVGAFKMAATLWDRQQTQVIMGYVNDDLIRNQMTLLAELRVALTLFRPKSMVKITFNGAA